MLFLLLSLTLLVLPPPRRFTLYVPASEAANSGYLLPASCHFQQQCGRFALPISGPVTMVPLRRYEKSPLPLHSLLIVYLSILIHLHFFVSFTTTLLHVTISYKKHRAFRLIYHMNAQANNEKSGIPDSLPQRPKKFNSFGKETSLTLNTYNVLQSNQSTIHQYDVSWGHGTDQTKRALVKKIWDSKAVKDALGEPKNMWIYDGNKLAW